MKSLLQSLSTGLTENPVGRQAVMLGIGWVGETLLAAAVITTETWMM